MNISEYEELSMLRDSAQERILFGIGESRSGIHFELINYLLRFGIRANGREDSVKKATQALEEYEQSRWGTSTSEEKYLNMA